MNCGQPRIGSGIIELIGVAAGIAGAVTVLFSIFFAFFLVLKSAIRISLDVTVFGRSPPSPFAFNILVNFTSWHKYIACLLI